MSEEITPAPEAAPANAEVLSSFVATASAWFFLAEEGHNPSVKTYLDAYHYIATSLSVGYANIFPVTQLGRAIGAVVMMVGPALAARALEESRAPGPSAGEAELLAKLDEVLAELRRLQR